MQKYNLLIPGLATGFLFLYFCQAPGYLSAQKQSFSRDDSVFVRETEKKYRNELAQNNLKKACKNLNDIAFRYWNHKDYQKAIDYYTLSLDLNDAMSDENGSAIIQNNLGMLYSDLRNYQKSYEYYQKTLAIHRSSQSEEGIIEALINSALALNKMKKFDRAILALEEALSVARGISNQKLMMDNLLKCYANLSEIYGKAGNLSKSRQYYEMYKTFNEKRKEINVSRLKNAVEEEKVLKELTLNQEKYTDQELSNNQDDLRKAAIDLNESDSSNRKLSEELQTSQSEVDTLQLKSQTDSRLADQEQLKNKETIAMERSIRNIMTIVALSLIAISFFIYKNYTQVKRSRKILAEKNNMINKQNSELESLNTIIARHNDRMKKELEVGQEIQMSMLPKTYPSSQRLDMYALLDPAREVGGDLYDYFMLDSDHLLFGIGDVSGKGVPAALFMAVTKTLVKAHGKKLLSPAKIMSAVNDDLNFENEQSMFVSYFLGNLNLKDGWLTYSNAGHLFPIIKNKNMCEKLEGLHGPVLGAIENFNYTESRIQLQPGEILLLYTDGVTEAMNAKREVYSEHRLLNMMNQIGKTTAKNLVDSIDKDVVAYRKLEDQSDDISIIALSRTSLS